MGLGMTWTPEAKAVQRIIDFARVREHGLPDLTLCFQMRPTFTFDYQLPTTSGFIFSYQQH